MKHLYFFFLYLLLSGYVSGQTTIQTTSYTGNGTGSSSPGTGITFNVLNSSTAPMLLTAVGYSPNTANPMELWYSSTSLTGATGAVNATNPAWTLLDSKAANSYSTVANTVIVDQFFSGLTLTIPSNTQYRFAVITIPSTARYSSATSPSPTVFSGSGVDMITTNSMWGGSSNISNTGRYYFGSITVEPALPCVSPPTPGVATADPMVPCAGNTVALSLTGNSYGLTQSYQWQSGATSTGPWTNMGSPSGSPQTNITASTTTYYRCAVTCGTSTLYSTPVQVTVPGLFPGGTYTINAASPTGGTNFHSFADAANAIRCGTTSSIVLNVVTGSGPYTNDRFVLPHIATQSATNTITINGNGNIISSAGTGGGDAAVISLEGTDYVTVDNLNINVTSTTYGYGVFLTDDANNNTINNCTINLGTTATASTMAGIVVSGGSASATTADSKCDSNTFSNNTVIGGYYGITLVGNGTTTPIYNNKLINNTIRDMYAYHTYMSGNNGTLVEGNDISRPNRTTVTTFYGIYMVTCRNMTVNANKIHNPFDNVLTSTSTAYGFYNSGASVSGSENIISNNIVYNFNGNGTHYGVYNTGGGYYKYYYNTINFDYNASASTATYNTYGFYQTTATSGIDLRNNIFSVSRGGATNKYCIRFNTATATYTGDRNVYYMGATSGLNNLGYYAGVDIPTLAGWQTATAQDANSIGIDPLFTAPATGNLLPTATGVDNLGLPVSGITADILNTPRNATTPDPGAFEMAPSCAMPTGLAATGITGTGANLNWTAVTGASGYQYTVNTSATPPTGAGTPTSGTTYNATGLTPGATYYLHVRTACGSSFSNWASFSFTTLCTAPTGLAATGVTTTGANLSWNAITGVTGFEYAVNTSATPPASGTATAGTTYNPSGLTPSTNYYLHVRTQCNATTFSSWTSIPFTTQSPSCSAPTGLVASGLTPNGVTLNWNAASPSTGYEYAITTSATPPTSGNTIAATNYTAGGLTPGTAYYAHVRNQCAVSLFSIWTTVSFTTPYPPCNAPNVSLSNITVGGLTISWAAVSGAVGYEYAIDVNATPPAAGTTTTNTSETVAGLIDDAPYFVHVRTNCGAGGFSPWVNLPFATAAYCTAPTAIISNITESRADINWNAMSSALGYEYSISTSMIPPASGIATSGLNYNADQLLPDTHYYIHLLSVCASDRSNWSTSGFVTPSATGIKNTNTAAGGIEVFPNPVRNLLTVKMSGQFSTNSRLLLTDITGKVISSYEPKGSQAEINMSSLPQGVYMLKYLGDNGNSTVKVVKE